MNFPLDHVAKKGHKFFLTRHLNSHNPVKCVSNFVFIEAINYPKKKCCLLKSILQRTKHSLYYKRCSYYICLSKASKSACGFNCQTPLIKGQ